MAINISQVVLVLHISVIVYSIIGIVATGFRFGLDKNSYGVKEVEDIVLPDFPDPPDVNSSKEIINEYRQTTYELVDNFHTLSNQYADFHVDPQSYVMIPFVLTLFMSIYFMVFRLLDSGTYKSTSMLNCTVVLWFITLVYNIFYLIESSSHYGYLDFHVKEYLLAWESTVYSVNSSLLFLLFILIAASGRCLRVCEVHWPRCNFLNLFTLDFIFTSTRLAINIIIAAVFDYHTGPGIYTHNPNYCSEHFRDKCRRKKYSVVLYYLSVPLLLMNILVSLGHLLSLIWGKNNRTHDISAGLLSVTSCLFISFSASFIEEVNDEAVYIFLTISTILNMFHTWTLWSNWKFMMSPPKILKLVCGRKTSTAEGETDGAIRSEIPTESTDEVESVIPSVEGSSSDSMNKSRCLLVNVFLTGLCLAGLVLAIISENWVITPVLCSCLIKAFVATITVLTIGSPPPANAAQVLVEIILESVVFTVTIIVTFSSSSVSNNTYSEIVGGLSIAVLLLKIFEAFKRSPIQVILEMMNPSQPLITPNTMGEEGAETADQEEGEVPLPAVC